MHPDLSPHLHSSECNALIKELQSCHDTNKFMRFVGACSDIHRQVYRCMMKEREENRKKNAGSRWKKTSGSSEENIAL